MPMQLTITVDLPAATLRRPFRAALAAHLAPALRALPPGKARHATLTAELLPGALTSAGKRLQVVLTLPAADTGLAPECLSAVTAAMTRPGAQAWRCAAVAAVEMAAPPMLRLQPDLDLRVSLHTPLVYAARSGAPRLDAASFLDLVQQRHLAVLGKSGDWPDTERSLGLLAHLAHDAPAAGPLSAVPVSGLRRPGDVVAPAQNLSAPAVAQGRGTALIGHLFLRKLSPALLAALCRLQAFGLVLPSAELPLEWRGHYTLAWQAGPWLDLALLHRRRLVVLAGSTLARQDAVPLPGADGQPLDPEALAAAVLARLAGNDALAAAPTSAFALHRDGHAPRIVERLELPDLLAQQHALQVLQPVLERCMEPCSHAYRPGRGRDSAIAAVRAALTDGWCHVLKADVAQCFASIAHAPLLGLLDELLPQSDVALRRLLRAAITQPFVLEGKAHTRTSGLAQGAPLSPLLVNLMLSALDRSIDTSRWRFVRYADDMVLLARSRIDAQAALVHVQQALAGLGLTLAAHKTHVGHFSQGFEFLGEQLSPRTLEPVQAAVAAHRKPLLVTEPYLQLGVNGAALEARRNGKLLGTWPLRRLSGLLVLARCTLSTTLLERCSAHDIPIAVALRSGKQVAVLTPNQRHTHQAQHRHACWHEAQPPGSRLALAGAVVQTKLGNTASLVQQREPGSPLLEVLAEARRAAARATSTDALRGHEGAAARAVFRWLQQQIVPGQREAFAARRRARGAPDRLNSVLNLGYYLLFTRLNAMLRLRGLNPYLGWLHDGDDDYETLVYDLMEPFRPFVDRLLLRQINRQALRAVNFESADGEHRLKRDAVRDFANAFEHMMGEPVGSHRLRDLLWMQVRSVEQMVHGQGALWLFQWQLRKQPVGAPDDEPSLLTLDTDPWLDDLPTDPGEAAE